MPQQPPVPGKSYRTNLSFTVGTGPTLQPVQISADNLGLPFQGQAETISLARIIGIDAVPYSFTVATGSQTVTFPNLPQRNNNVNPLSASSTSQQPYSVSVQDHLLFVAFVQGLSAPNGTVVGVQPIAIDRNNVRVPGPFLGSNVFATFQAKVTANSSNAGTVAGMAVGLLILSMG